MGSSVLRRREEAQAQEEDHVTRRQRRVCEPGMARGWRQRWRLEEARKDSPQSLPREQGLPSTLSLEL